MEHTQGKWSVRGYNIITKSGGKRIRIASVDLRKGMKPPKFTEVRANANLIANAPEMLSALKEISNLELDNGFDDWSVALKDWAQRVGKIAEETIAKAEGK